MKTLYSGPCLRLFCIALILGIVCNPSVLAALGQDREIAEKSEEKPSTESTIKAEGLFGSTEAQTILPAELSSDQIIQFFTQFSAQDSIEEAFSPLLDSMMVAGEPIERWNESGIDILAEIDAIEGGIKKNMLREAGDQVLVALDFSGTVSPDLSDFQSYALRPDPVGLVTEKGFISFSEGLWFETTHQREKVGNALCYFGYAGVTLHSRKPHTEWSEDDLLTSAAIFALVDRTASREVCIVYDRLEDGRYISRAFLRDGRELPVLNQEMDPSDVMPVGMLAEFMKGQPSDATTEEQEQ